MCPIYSVREAEVFEHNNNHNSCVNNCWIKIMSVYHNVYYIKNFIIYYNIIILNLFICQ